MRKLNLGKFKAAIAGVIGVLIVGLFLGYIYLDDIFSTIQDPGQPFQTYEPPAASDYALLGSWLAQPDLGVDPFTLMAKGDVFVVVPSVYRGGEHWNLPSDDLKRKSKLQRIVRPNYVAPYGESGRWPIVLVGHNQGASHVQRLLMDFFQGDLKKRLAVAYVIDHPLPLDSFQGPLSQLQPCTSAEQTQCVVAFGSFTPKDKVIAERFAEKSLVHNGRHYDAINSRPTLCVNPLLWTQSEDYAPPRLHLGGVAAEGLDPDMIPASLTKQSGAQCQNGLLLVDSPRSKSLRRPLQVGAKFRTLPSNLFYEDLKQDAKRRVQNLLDTKIVPERAGPMLDDFEIQEIKESPVVKPEE